jgi:hypothetical protein
MVVSANDVCNVSNPMQCNLLLLQPIAHSKHIGHNSNPNILAKTTTLAAPAIGTEAPLRF